MDLLKKRISFADFREKSKEINLQIMEETVQQREYTLTYVQNNELAYVAKCRRWLSEKYQDAGYSIMQMQDLLKWNFDLRVPREHIRMHEKIIQSKKQGKLTARERKLWHQMNYEWIKVVRRKVVEEQCTPKHKQGIWLTYDEDD